MVSANGRKLALKCFPDDEETVPKEDDDEDLFKSAVEV